MHSQFWRFWTQIEIHPGAQIDSGVFIDHGGGLVIGETAIVEKGVLLYHGVTLGGTGKDCGKRHPTIRKGVLISAHAQVIGPVEIGENAKVGAAAVVVADVPSDVTVVGIPAKIVRVHGKKMSLLFMKLKPSENITSISWTTLRKLVTDRLVCRG